MNTRTKVIGIAVLVLIAGVAYVEYPKQEAVTACTTEAKICPDGSSVGRTGEKCEFAACPSVEATTTASIGQKIIVNGVSITPTEVVEDSRCPAGVYCIQAGTVRVKATLQTGDAAQNITLKLGTPVTVAGKTITLDEVLPAKFPAAALTSKDYRFTFSVKDAAVSSTGTLKGNVAVGPVCPVENPYGVSCTPTAEMYAAAKVFVYMPDKKTLVKTLTPDAQGKFSVTLPAGTYYIDMIHQTVGGTYGVPTTVTIASGQTVTLALKVDTGLR
jgi:hypothetical protein